MNFQALLLGAIGLAFVQMHFLSQAFNLMIQIAHQEYPKTFTKNFHLIKVHFRSKCDFLINLTL